MKKVGIMTFHRAENYGAALQAYALQQRLSIENFNTFIIDYRCKSIENNYKLFTFNNIKNLISSIIFVIPNVIRKISFLRFRKNNFNLTKSYYDIVKDYPDLDIYITGSDQVWNPQITNGLDDGYLLNFGPKQAKRISYAASIGKRGIDNSDDYVNKLEKIDCISVRELTAKKDLQSITNKEINVVLDPVFLLNKQQWLEVLPNKKNKKQKYIFCYDLDYIPDFYNVANEISKKTGLPIIYFSRRNKGYCFKCKSKFTCGPLEFLYYLKNSEYVVTTSFHATAFSLIFNKKFWVVPPMKTSSRIVDILKIFDLDNRIILDYRDFKNRDYDENIDFNSINSKLDKEREKSLKWLSKALKK